MTRFYKKTKYGVVMLLVLAMLLQVVGPVVGNYVYATGTSEALIVEIDENDDGSTQLKWKFDLEKANGEKMHYAETGLTLKSEFPGALMDGGIELGRFIISKDGLMTVTIHDEFLKELEKPEEIAEEEITVSEVTVEIGEDSLITISAKVTGASEDEKAKVEIVNEEEKVVDSKEDIEIQGETARAVFENLEPGKYYARITVDEISEISEEFEIEEVVVDGENSDETKLDDEDVEEEPKIEGSEDIDLEEKPEIKEASIFGETILTLASTTNSLDGLVVSGDEDQEYEDEGIESHIFTGSFKVEGVEEEVDESDPKEITENIIDKIRLKYKNGTEFEDGDLIGVDEDLRFELDWSLPNDHGYKNGDYFEFKLPRQLTVYSEIKDIDLDGYGTAVVGLNGMVRFTFNEKIDLKSNINGTFWSDTILKVTEITSTEETIEIVFDDKPLNKIIVNVKPTGGQAISKSVHPIGGTFNTKEIEWTVVVNTTRESLTKAIIDDPILAGQELVLDSIVLKEVEVNLTGEVIRELDGVISFVDNSTIKSLNIGLGDTNKAYKLTFRTKMTAGEENKEGSTTYENTAYLKSEGKDDAQHGASVSVSRPESLVKTSSTFDKDGRFVEWEVRANFNEQSLKQGDIITDEFKFTVGDKEVTDVFVIESEKITIVQVDKFNSSGEPEITSGAKILFDIKVEGNKVTYTLKEATNKAFILKYKTELKEGAYINKDGTITNTVTLNGKTDTASGGVSQQVGKKEHGNINYKDKTIDWTITINADRQKLKNLIVTDDFKGSGQKLFGSITVSPSIDNDRIKIDSDEEGFEINFGDTKETYIITYKTKFTYDFGKIEEHKPKPNFENRVKITYDTNNSFDYELIIGDKIDPNLETKNNGAKNVTVDQTRKEMTWKVDINYNQLVLTDAKMNDTIPANQSLIDDPVKIFETSIEENGNIKLGTEVTEQFKNKIDKGENHVNVNFGEISQSYRIEFKTKDKDGIYNSDEVYTNTAQFIPRTGERHNLTANAELLDQGQFLGKTGTHNKGDWTIDWKVDVNKSLSKISNVKVTDDLGETSAQILLEDTIKVTKAGSSDELSKEKYTLKVVGNTLEVVLLGEITDAYVITYSSYIIADKTTNIKNKAEVHLGKEIKGTKDKIVTVEVKISDAGGSATGETGSLVIEKTEEGSNRPLANVAFELIKKVGNQEILVREGTTDVNGKLEWIGLKYGGYTLNEVIPEGYTGVEKQTVTIYSEDPEGVKVLKIENQRKTGTAKIIKVDSITKEVIEGVEFKIKNLTTNQEYTFTTDVDGVILKEVPFGEYTVEEIKTPIGYKPKKDISNIIVEIGETATIEVENVAFVTGVTVKKTWIDEKVSDRPKSIKVNLLQNGIPFKSDIEIKAGDDGNWSHTFKDLPEYDTKGNRYIYTVTEHDVPGYNSEVDGFEITNTRAEEKSIKITKAWLDDNSKNRPDTIEVELFRSITDGEKEFVAKYEIKAANNWKFETRKLPAFDSNGKAYTYEIKEKDIEGYESKVNGLDITNLRVGKTEVTGQKEWRGGPNIKPTIQLQLYRNGEKLGASVELKDGTTEYTWRNLDEFDENGVVYKYTIDEVKVPSRYRKSISEDGLTITNRYSPPTDPTDPYEPEEKPKKPVDPEKPVDPNKPTDPEKPTAPTDPDKPTDPTTPGGPGDEFENVGGGNPSGKPEGEDEFENVGGGNPSGRPEGEDDKPKLPKTGSASPVILYGLGGLSILVGAMLRRKKED